MSLSLYQPLSALISAPLTTDSWNGFERIGFTFQGRQSYLICPPTPLPGNPWLWRPTFLDAWLQTDLQLIQRGFHLVYTEVLADYASPTGILHGKAFRDLLVEAGLARKFAFVALSRGGLFAFRYAESYPQEVAAIYADAPVCDFRSWPGGQGKGQRGEQELAQALQSHGMTETQLFAPDYQPLNRLKPLAEHRIPLIHVCGEADEVVPFEENTVILAKNYRELGGLITVIPRPGVKHHPHGLENPTPVVEFLFKHAANVL